jgi:hypothetical protein
VKQTASPTALTIPTLVNKLTTSVRLTAHSRPQTFSLALKSFDISFCFEKVKRWSKQSIQYAVGTMNTRMSYEKKRA